MSVLYGRLEVLLSTGEEALLGASIACKLCVLDERGRGWALGVQMTPHDLYGVQRSFLAIKNVSGV